MFRNLVCLGLFLTATILVRANEIAVAFGGASYRTVTCHARQIRVLWKDDTGARLERFGRARQYLESKNLKPLMLMNGGIFEPGFVPSGLCIQESREWTGTNQKPGRGNFFLKPNGIFSITGDMAAILETSAYLSTPRSPVHAIQSGPMLVVGGKPHPAFMPDSPNRLHRNGVGILPDGRVLFAITSGEPESWVNLHGFASFFLSRGCKEALFLDGDISQMWTNGQAPKTSNPFASIIAVLE